ncbi:hypothetical protein GCM10017687_09830 [Streptomyces echinatus]
MRLLDDLGDTYALGLAVDQAMVARVERGLALSARLVSQSPIGLAILDPDLRYVTVNRHWSASTASPPPRMWAGMSARS